MDGRGRVGFRKQQQGFGRVGGWFKFSGSCPPSCRQAGEFEWREDRVPTGYRYEKDMARSRKAGRDRCVLQRRDGRANRICGTLPDFANCNLSMSGPRTRRDTGQRIFAPLFFARARKERAPQYVRQLDPFRVFCVLCHISFGDLLAQRPIRSREFATITRRDL